MDKERFKVCITVGLILQNEKEVLLMKRCNTGYMDEKYALVAGHVEVGESLKQAIVREAKEEIGIDINESELHYVCGIRRGDNSEYINFYFSINKYNGTITNMEPNKCNDLKWFDINKLPDNIIVNDKKAIYNMENNISFEEYNF